MNKLTIRKATHDDAIWISDEIEKAAREGHFSETLTDDFQRMGMIAQIIVHGVLPILKLRNGKAKPELLPADLWVADIGNSHAGFLLSLFEYSRLKPTAVELHLGGVANHCRLKGVFSSLVTNQILMLPTETRIYGRCYPQSEVAILSLKKLGFEISKRGDPTELQVYGATVLGTRPGIKVGGVDEK